MAKFTDKVKRRKAKENKVLLKAIDAAGGQKILAKKLAKMTKTKIRQGNISNWMNICVNPMPPAEYVIPIERIVNREVTRHELRPDLYPFEEPDMYPVKYPYDATSLKEYTEAEALYQKKSGDYYE